MVEVRRHAEARISLEDADPTRHREVGLMFSCLKIKISYYDAECNERSKQGSRLIAGIIAGVDCVKIIFNFCTRQPALRTSRKFIFFLKLRLMEVSRIII